jgi:hypothetical protein
MIQNGQSSDKSQTWNMKSIDCDVSQSCANKEKPMINLRGIKMYDLGKLDSFYVADAIRSKMHVQKKTKSFWERCSDFLYQILGL